MIRGLRRLFGLSNDDQSDVHSNLSAPTQPTLPLNFQWPGYPPPYPFPWQNNPYSHSGIITGPVKPEPGQFLYLLPSVHANSLNLSFYRTPSSCNRTYRLSGLSVPSVYVSAGLRSAAIVKPVFPKPVSALPTVGSSNTRAPRR